MWRRYVVLRFRFPKNESSSLDWDGDIRRLTTALLTYAAVAVVSALQKDLCFVAHFAAQTAAGDLFRDVSHQISPSQSELLLRSERQRDGGIEGPRTNTRTGGSRPRDWRCDRAEADVEHDGRRDHPVGMPIGQLEETRKVDGAQSGGVLADDPDEYV